MQHIHRSIVNSFSKPTTGKIGRPQRHEQPAAQGSTVDRQASNPTIIRNKAIVSQIFSSGFKNWFTTANDTQCFDWYFDEQLMSHWSPSACLVTSDSYWKMLVRERKRMCIDPPHQWLFDFRGIKLCIRRSMNLFNKKKETICMWFKKNYNFGQRENMKCIERKVESTLFDARPTNQICVVPKYWWVTDEKRRICLEHDWWWNKY